MNRLNSDPKGPVIEYLREKASASQMDQHFRRFRYNLLPFFNCKRS
jgi:hypothetical protein